MSAVRLGVNVDHVATLRQARGTDYPDPIRAAQVAVEAGADLITVHPREDGRHIQKQDVVAIKNSINVPLNLEMGNTPQMVEFALKVNPAWVCLVPEKREELTTEGGLDVLRHYESLRHTVEQLHAKKINVSLFIEADKKQIEATRELGVRAIEIHTGHYADASDSEKAVEFNKLKQGAIFAKQIGLQVHAGHGLHYENTRPILAISEIEELNIGHAIVAESIFIGFSQAVKRMKELLG